MRLRRRLAALDPCPACTAGSSSSSTTMTCSRPSQSGFRLRCAHLAHAWPAPQPQRTGRLCVPICKSNARPSVTVRARRGGPAWAASRLRFRRAGEGLGWSSVRSTTALMAGRMQTGGGAGGGGCYCAVSYRTSITPCAHARLSVGRSLLNPLLLLISSPSVLVRGQAHQAHEP